MLQGSRACTILGQTQAFRLVDAMLSATKLCQLLLDGQLKSAELLETFIAKAKRKEEVDFGVEVAQNRWF